VGKYDCQCEFTLIGIHYHSHLSDQIIDHPSQYDIQHLVAFTATHKHLDNGWDKVTLLHLLTYMHGEALMISQKFPTTCTIKLIVGCIQNLQKLGKNIYRDKLHVWWNTLFSAYNLLIIHTTYISWYMAANFC